LPQVSSNSIAYALYASGVSNGFFSIAIDLSSGSYSWKQLNGFDSWEEIIRTFEWDEDRSMFYLLQANFTQGAKQPYAIHLYTIDPVAGTVQSALVKGATEYSEVDVPGFVYSPKQRKIIMSTLDTSAGNFTYRFYLVDPLTAVATLQSTYSSQQDSYVGWFHACSESGLMLYRVGFEDVVDQATPGIGLTNIAKPQASTVWQDSYPLPNLMNFYMSLNVLRDDVFVSLATDQNDGSVHIIQWDRNASTVTFDQVLSDG
jgi:hypothetical protein